VIVYVAHLLTCGIHGYLYSTLNRLLLGKACLTKLPAHGAEDLIILGQRFHLMPETQNRGEISLAKNALREALEIAYRSFGADIS
jgi:hypothetical protein